MSRMANLEKDICIADVDIYNFGPWVLTPSSIIVSNARITSPWRAISQDWLNFHNKMILEHATNRSIAVQAGGWQGVYPFLLSNIFQTVYTFEPDPMNFYCLSRNCQRENVIKIQAALSDSIGGLTLEGVENSGMHRINNHADKMYETEIVGSQQVLGVTVDSLNLTDCGFIMLDVENYELIALNGALNTIEEYKPLICTEKSCFPERDAAIEKILVSYGYKLISDLDKDYYWKCF